MAIALPPLLPEINLCRFQMDGIKVEVGRVQEDLTFMKKGYSGVFDIVSNAVDSQQCGFDAVIVSHSSQLLRVYPCLHFRLLLKNIVFTLKFLKYRIFLLS